MIINLWYHNLSGCIVRCGNGFEENYDACVIATHAPDTLRMLGNEATYEEVQVLGAFQYVYRYICLSHFLIVISPNIYVEDPI